MDLQGRIQGVTGVLSLEKIIMYSYNYFNKIFIMKYLFIKAIYTLLIMPTS